MRDPASADTLQIAGLARLSSCDWPGHLVATVFLQGCPLACGYCHNPGILDPTAPGVFAWREVLELLARRRGLLDGVVFSGGEPTRQRALADAMRQVREFGFGVGLHTAGPYPRTFAEVLPLCDWIGLDIKSPEDLYGRVTGVATAGAKAFACLRMALQAGVPLQVRTTVDHTTMSDDDIARVSETLRELGVVEHVLQEVRLEGVREEYRDLLPGSHAPTRPSVGGARREDHDS